MKKNKSPKSNWTNNFPEPVYSSRFERNDYASGLITKFFSDTKKILNIGGGGKRHLEKSFNTKLKVKITEIDITGDNDLNLDLDLETKLPYENNSFDMTLALDNLEHIENFHQIFFEMFRVTKKNILISLPNSVETFFEILKNNKQSDIKERGHYSKFYGLPTNKPKDRHKWFLTIGDIERFFLEFVKDKDAEVEFFTNTKLSFKKFLLTFFLSERLKKELRYPWVWILIKKNN
jgi:hypothetical protein